MASPGVLDWNRIEEWLRSVKLLKDSLTSRGRESQEHL